MLEVEGETAEQLARTEENITALEEALALASGGMVTFGESLVEPVELTDRLSGGASRAATDVSGLTEALASAPAAFDALGVSADQFDGIMQTVEGSMETAFMSMIDGTTSASDAFKVYGYKHHQRTVSSSGRAAFGQFDYGRNPRIWFACGRRSSS